MKGACSIPKKKLIQLFIIIPIAVLALLYGSGYLSQLFSNYRTWQETGAVFGTSPAFPDAGFFPCLAAAFHFPYGLYGLGLCIGALALLILMVMRMGYSEGGEYDRRRNLVYSNKGTYGTAGFMSRKELAGVLDLVPDIRKHSGTILGELDHQVICIPPKTRFNGNLAVYGASGSKKTRAFCVNMILQCAARKSSLVICDPKSELYEKTSEYLRDQGYTVRVFNLVTPSASDSWNCLAEVGGQELMAQLFCDVIIKNTGGEERDHFWDSAEMNLLKALVLYVSISYPKEKQNIGEVYQLLTASSEQDLKALFDVLPLTHPAKAPYSIFKQASEGVRGGVIIGLGSRLQVFQNKDIRNITSYNEIDLELPGKQPCAYYCITSDQDSTFDFLSSLFLSFVFIRLVRYADEHCPGGELPVPVHVLGEELCACGVIPDLSRKISVIRSRNLSMSCVFQNLAGLQNRYPYNQWQEILGNCDVQLFLGCTDALTAEFISDRTGEVSISVTSKAKQLGTWRVSNYTPEYRETSGVGRRKLMTMDEVLRMDVDTVTFGNDKMGSLLIVKKDAVTGAPISDVEFFITDSDGSVIGNANGKYVTDSAGTIRIDGLTPGMTVIAKEVRAKDGYILDDTPQSIKIKRNAVMTLEFRNQPKGGVLVKKVDAVTNAPISDVEFLVTDSDGNLIGNSNGKFVTDSAGTFTITDIAPGTTLIIKETRAKDGYLLDDTPQTVKVKSNEVVTVEFRNQPKGNLIIVKQDSVTKEPLEGVEFKIVYADGSYVDAAGGTLSSTGLYRTDKAGKISISGISGTIVATEVKSIPGYTIDENTRSQTVVVRPNDTQTLHFYNTPVGGVEIIKVNEDNHSERIPNTTFEIRKVDDALVDTVTTDKNGRVFVPLKDGSYYAKEVTSNKSFRLDDTPHYFEIKDGKHVTLQVTNKKLSGIVIHKIDSATGEGIYGVKFVLYDANKKPIGEYTSDDEGYIYIDEIPGGLSGRFYLRELEAAPGYTLDKQYKTVYVSPGKTVEIEWENTAVTGQIQIYKYAAEYNEVTGTAAGTPLKGAVYEIVNARSGKVVDYITTDARGVAASKPLPLTRYQIREVTAPAYWQLDPTVHDVTLEYPGQIIKLSAYDKPSSLGVSITKRGNAQVMAGQSMRYDLTVANTSNVPLESFFWHDKIPYDVARPTTLTTGTYSARLNYRILYKTNCNTSYQVLASNLLTSNNYSFSLNAIPMQAGEVVTDIYFDFGKVPVGFQSVVNSTLSVMVNGNAVNGYQMVNRADVGGKYQDTWQTATASWVTVVRRLWSTPTLPKTGY